MTRDEVLARLEFIFDEHFSVDMEDTEMFPSFHVSNHIFETYGGDELDQVIIIMAVEDEFDIIVDDVTGETLFTVQQFLDYLTPVLENK